MEIISKFFNLKIDLKLLFVQMEIASVTKTKISNSLNRNLITKLKITSTDSQIDFKLQ